MSDQRLIPQLGRSSQVYGIWLAALLAVLIGLTLADVFDLGLRALLGTSKSTLTGAAILGVAIVFAAVLLFLFARLSETIALSGMAREELAGLKQQIDAAREQVKQVRDRGRRLRKQS